MWQIEKTVKKGDYIYAIVYNHPKRTKSNYVLYHRVVMENYLGRLLEDKEIVHHINGNKKDNRLENLQVMLWSEHCSFHANLKGQKMVELQCPNCNKLFHKRKGKTHLVRNNKQYTTCSPQCRGKFSRTIQLFGMTEDTILKIRDNVVKEYHLV